MFWRKKDVVLNAIYPMHFIDAFAFSLVGIFIPIYFLELGYEFKDIIYYFIAHNISLLSFSVIAVLLGQKIGLINILRLRVPFIILYFFALYNWIDIQYSIFLIAFLGGIQAAFYWTPLNIIFTRSSKPRKMGVLVSKLIAYPQVSAIVAPILGALIIKIFGFASLFIISFIVILLSLIPLINIDVPRVKYNLNLKKGIKWFKKYKKYMVAELFDNFGGETEGIIWPVFIFLVSASVVQVGFISALIPLGSIIFTLLIGRLIDNKPSKIYMKIGAIALVFIWLVRYYFDNASIYFISTVLAGFSLSLILIPFTSTMTKFAKKEVVDEFIIFREVFFFIGRMCLFLVALVLISNIKLLFPLAGLAYLYFLFL